MCGFCNQIPCVKDDQKPERRETWPLNVPEHVYKRRLQRMREEIETGVPRIVIYYEARLLVKALRPPLRKRLVAWFHELVDSTCALRLIKWLHGLGM